MNFSRKSRLCLSASALAVAVSGMPGAAMAQEQDDANLAFDEIFVTARKRPETQTEIPLSVKAFGQNDLDKRGIQDSANLSDFVPGFKFEPIGTGGQSGRANPNIRFRGIGVQIGLGGASDAGALFWDGAYVPQGIGVVPLIDLQQTEVIKGPQTAFFGRNTFAGAVNFLPAEPTEELEVRLRGQASATDVQVGYNFNAIVSGPITDKIGARVAVSTEKRPGVTDFQDGTPLGEEVTHAILGTLKFDVTDSTFFKVTGYFVDSEDTSALSSIQATVAPGDCDLQFTGNLRDVVTGESLGSFTTDLSQNAGSVFCGSIPDWDDPSITTFNPAFGGPPPEGALVANAGAISSFDYVQSLPAEFGDSFIDAPDGLGNTYQTWRVNLSGEHEFDSGHTLAGFVSIGANKNWGIFDNNYGRPATSFFTGAVTSEISYRGFVREQDDFSAELRLTSDQEGRLRYMVGVNYFTDDQIFFDRGFAPPGFATIVSSEVIGLFGSLDFDITEELTLSLEGRFQWDTLDLPYDDLSGQQATSTFVPQSQDFAKFMPRAIISYQPEGLDLNVYASFSQSFLQGTPTNAVSFAGSVPDSGLNPDTVGFFTPTQKLNAFEVGVKQQVTGNLQYSIAAYFMDWNNQAFFVLSPTFVSISLPGDSEYYGIELETIYQPTDWLNLLVGYNYVDASFTDFVSTGSVAAGVLAPGLITSTTAFDASGNSIRYIPAHEANFAADFNLEGVTGVQSFFRTDVIYTGSFFVDNFEYNKVKGAARVNIRAGANITEFLQMEVFGNNIFNNQRFGTNGGTTFTSFFTQSDRRAFGAVPRGAEWGIRFTADF
ncbi:MAG: TonB-dependent receptor plug domain-containing protein [Pseudomonadota bacterium]